MRRFTIAAALLLAVAAIAIPVALAGGGNSTSADISFSNNATLNAGGSVTLHVTYFCLGSAFVPDAFVDLQEPKGATEVDGFIDFTPVCDNKQHQVDVLIVPTFNPPFVPGTGVAEGEICSLVCSPFEVEQEVNIH